MQNIETRLDKRPNLRLLHEEIEAQLGAAFVGLSGRGKVLTLHLEDGATEADIDTARSTAESHDSQQMTAEQQKARQLETDRDSELSARLNENDYSGETALIQALARKVAWLEREVADLRGRL